MTDGAAKSGSGSDSTSQVTKGILLMIAGSFLLTCQDGLTKWMTSDFGAGEIIFYRSIIGLPLLLLVIVFWPGNREGSLRGLQLIRLRQPVGTLLRGGVAFLTTMFVIAAFAQMPLAEALAIVFLSPLIVVALSALMLREPVGWRRWSAVLFGFFGVLVMTRPWDSTTGAGGSLGWYILLPLGAALFGALRDVVTRKLGGREHPLTVLFYTTLVSGLGASIALFDISALPSLSDWGFFLVIGVLSIAAHGLLIQAFMVASGAIIAPFKYLSLVWAASIGFVIWGDVPGSLSILGAVMVAGSGLYVFLRERKAA